MPTPPSHLQQADIARRIPHQGLMCLLDAVTAWDDSHIVCRAGSHRVPDNPLRAQGRLGAACGVEFAAQAMAVHGALLAEREAQAGSAAPRVGYLASVRSVNLHVQRLDTIAADLTVTAERLLGDANHILYHFRLEAGPHLLLEGRVAIVLDAAMLRQAIGSAQVPGESL
ncbi:MAG: 3-hydroxylacyl-ACP dehydratase [Burkholderiaceae bacterium]|nr:MAG: 3-hydroxylacyl-ACP dehydratase [Burkholderiaceae bacterium]